jgi:FMN phosphatase YigB (HAD superfamily)
MKPRAIFFDLDDTLCNTSVSRRERATICARILHEADSSHAVPVLVESILRPVSDTDWPRGITPVLRELGLEETPHGLRARGAWFFEDCEHLICSYDGCLDVLESLAPHYTLGIITNGPVDIQKRKFDALGIGEYVAPELFLASGLVGFDKPDPRIYQHALKLAGVRPEEAVMVGDWFPVDVAGAQAAGMRGVWFNPRRYPVPDGYTPDATIASHAELLSLLEEWS